MDSHNFAHPKGSAPRGGVEQAQLAALLERYAMGDETVFGDLYRILAPRLRRFCLKLSRDGSAAEDVFQDALLRLHRARASYIPDSPALPWIFAIARSAFLDSLRYQKRHPEDLPSSDDSQSEYGSAACRDGSPESNVRHRALQVLIDRELRSMSEKCRTAYVLLREEGLSAADAARVLETTEEAVKQRAHRAYEQIRGALRAAGWDEDVPRCASGPVASGAAR
jgi:RNA polymerase sigma-70 factor (ECF subfamily)